ncbi:DNA alkylation repair protein [Maribellus maritimus]|uniref:DNA alkylation repair protein n=1 Tax=Maribellus maritimus TaxID=2870838 RepID=UPI001EEAE3CF|nr:DNA alkylation repair protein [Maribellus maritimus]MCG6188934.1 DNA alkylation repair protein [Maribellus maritimus]
MNKIEQKHKQVIDFYIKNADKNVVKKLSRYFREGLDAYGCDRKKEEAQHNRWLKEWEEDMTTKDFLDFGDRLVATGKYEEAHCATYFILSRKNEFTPETFERIGKWLENGIQNWANTDALCMSVLSIFIFEKIVQPKDFSGWTSSPSKWKRRAVPVTFVEAIKKGHQADSYLKVIENLMEDPEEDVQKGLGTFLREVWKNDPEKAENFLLKWKEKCGRKIIHYATEKMSKTDRERFKRTKK